MFAEACVDLTVHFTCDRAANMHEGADHIKLDDDVSVAVIINNMREETIMNEEGKREEDNVR